MALGIKIGGATSSGRRVQRYKTAGAGTLRVFDFKNPLTWPAGVTPTAAIPTGTKLYDLPDASVAAPLVANAMTAVGAHVQEAGGGIAFAGAYPSKYLQLPDDFKIPALNGADGRYLILLAMRPGSAAAPAGTEGLAGWASTTAAANSNWCLYRNAGNANTFSSVGGSFGNFGVLSAAWHRLGIEMIKNGAAGTVSHNLYLDGVLISTGAALAQAAMPQPAGAPPALGVTNFGGAGAGTAWGGAQIRNLALDSAPAADIVAADYAAWSARFT